MAQINEMREKRNNLTVSMISMEQMCQLLCSLPEAGIALPQDEKVGFLSSIVEGEELIRDCFEEYMNYLAEIKAEVEKM